MFQLSWNRARCSCCAVCVCMLFTAASNITVLLKICDSRKSVCSNRICKIDFQPVTRRREEFFRVLLFCILRARGDFFSLRFYQMKSISWPSQMPVRKCTSVFFKMRYCCITGIRTRFVRFAPAFFCSLSQFLISFLHLVPVGVNGLWQIKSAREKSIIFCLTADTEPTILSFEQNAFFGVQFWI